ncbi:hypothetical protein H8E77_27780 [bacterium]|nr:hypothetical protein [bacterium]
MYILVTFLIILGVAGWVFSIVVMKGEITYQLISMGVIALGIFAAHFWEEFFRDKEKK